MATNIIIITLLILTVSNEQVLTLIRILILLLIHLIRTRILSPTNCFSFKLSYPSLLPPFVNTSNAHLHTYKQLPTHLLIYMYTDRYRITCQDI